MSRVTRQANRHDPWHELVTLSRKKKANRAGAWPAVRVTYQAPEPTERIYAGTRYSHTLGWLTPKGDFRPLTHIPDAWAPEFVELLRDSVASLFRVTQDAGLTKKPGSLGTLGERMKFK